MRFYYLLLLIFLYGCTSGPRAMPVNLPAVAIDQKIQEISDNEGMCESDDIPLNWWDLFEDPQLSEFICTALRRNPTVLMARATILSAIATANKARSALFPTVLWAGDVSRQKLSETSIISFITFPPGSSTIESPLGPVPAGVRINSGSLPSPGGVDGFPIYFTQYETELALTYEFDFWNKNRDTLRAAKNMVCSKAADEAFVRLQMSIAVAQVYFQLQIDYERERVLQKLVDSREEYVGLIKRRMRSNIDNRISLELAESALDLSKQALLQIQEEKKINENQLKAYLAGNFEECIADIKVDSRSIPDVPVPTDLPLQLLARRPDIMSQIFLIQSAGWLIEVAKASFYPNINIVALGGYQTVHWPQLFLAKSTFFNIDPAFSLPIFDGGRLISNLRGSEADYDLAILKYNDLVLNAVKEALSGVDSLKSRTRQLDVMKKMVERQETVTRLTDLRMQNHLSSDLELVTAKINLNLGRDQELVTRGSVLQAVLGLIKAVGGGYHFVGGKNDCSS